VFTGNVVSEEEDCRDAPNYEKSCTFWVEGGFCSGNELLQNVYCKRSCGAC
jgi:hypothetical protein